MHSHFYHWHLRAEFKTEAQLLETRWNAASTFAGAANANDICALVRIAVYGVSDNAFIRRFTDHMIAADPTFPQDSNLEMLRVMATAALYSAMETPTAKGNAVALSLLATEFEPGRAKPVPGEFRDRPSQYLAEESERLRPELDVQNSVEALRNTSSDDNSKERTEALSDLSATILELDNALRRIAEENQFLWWLLGGRSHVLATRRISLTPEKYALPAAIEAASRVALIPPPASVEAIIEEVLGQCRAQSQDEPILLSLITDLHLESVPKQEQLIQIEYICPLISAIRTRVSSGRASFTLGEINLLPDEMKLSASKAAVQYFRELMAYRALSNLS